MPQNRKLSDLEAATLVSKQYRYQCFHITFSSTSNLANSYEYGSTFTWFTGKAHFRLTSGKNFDAVLIKKHNENIGNRWNNEFCCVFLCKISESIKLCPYGEYFFNNFNVYYHCRKHYLNWNIFILIPIIGQVGA